MEERIRHRAQNVFALRAQMAMAVRGSDAWDRSAWGTKSVYQNRGTGLAGCWSMSKPLVSDDLWAIVEPLLPAEPPKP
ncbi:MAG: hypothetical protein M3R02_03370, partial [Chloroflexota bacterium]|nr:hypothetical protein [Chloroflexota bacterium]